MSASSATLEIRGVTRRFGKNTAVSDINVSIPQGQMVGIIGRSGAGKSTLLRMINRLIDPSQGSIFFDGAEVSSLQGSPLRRWQRDCAMIFQQFNLVPRLDVLTNVLLGRLNHRSTFSNLLGMFSRTECAEAVAALERLDIARTALQPAGTLSGGQQQRVAIARAMMQQPKVLLADEPIASLDPLNAKVVMDSLRDINLREGITVVTNLHTLDTARAYCNRIIGMAAGKVVFDGAPEDLDRDAVRTVYGADANGVEISEAITSTSVTIKPKITVSAGPLEPAFPGY
ncbi:phosphonate ABC transporter ATP-binding protein [Mesorhizobium sp.]|uniref:phosphonate ABC transporter ATP-binding protein n=1 Tax=Mesorhizobium sp. TaxID=1871066 RepID=UPI000FE4EA8D|nr:phosphonate ABC transporter ATP-binding protein [Mesorhizobium sp.]RWA67655.1 MAG: phosphonate ABC transporter ATP-binding protein [Mesorhizobium sp.]RWA84977.1 MAG: phosphonate ABC transporter ATP-binding protein [Mesorhizobium sp.]